MGVVLKAPGAGPSEKKGVVLISFEYQWARLLLARWSTWPSSPRIFELVPGRPPRSPPYGMMNAIFPSVYPGPRIFTLISGDEDKRGNFSTLVRRSMLSRAALLASNWVNPSLYERREPEPVAKDIDIVMLANL